MKKGLSVRCHFDSANLQFVITEIEMPQKLLTLNLLRNHSKSWNCVYTEQAFQLISFYLRPQSYQSPLVYCSRNGESDRLIGHGLIL